MSSSRQVLPRRHTLTALLLCASPLLASAPTLAADWPERPIRMIIPFAAGAGADIVGRTFGEELLIVSPAPAAPELACMIGSREF